MGEYMSKGKQIANLKKISRNGFRDNFDWEAKIDFKSVDSETSYKSSKRKFLKRYGKYLIEEYKRKYGVYEISEEKVIEKNEKRFTEYIKEKFENKVEELKNEEYVEIPQFQRIRDYIKVLVKSDYPSLLIVGEGGTGKTRTTMKTLAKDSKDFDRISGKNTPLEFYHKLFENKKKEVLVLDDIEGLFDNDTSKAILRQATEVKDERKISYNTTSSKLEAPEGFELKAKLVLIGNRIPENDPVFNAIKDRTLFLRHRLSYRDKLRIISIMSQKEMYGIPLDERKEVLRHLACITSPATKNFSLRSWKKTLVMYKVFPERWKKIVRDMFDSDREIGKVLEMMKKGLDVREQIRRFGKEFGKSKRIYYKRKREVRHRAREVMKASRG